MAVNLPMIASSVLLNMDFSWSSSGEASWWGSSLSSFVVILLIGHPVVTGVIVLIVLGLELG